MPSGVYERPSARARFEAKFDRGHPDACWPWRGAPSGGYGSFRTGPAATTAHRFAYECYVRPLREGEVVDHVCRNPACVNPTHLEAVSMAENTVRGAGPGRASAAGRARTHCKRDHPLFGPNLKRDSRGYRMCRSCQRDKAAEWKRSNRDRVNELQRSRRAEAFLGAA